ncbi:hypothetical protein BDF21DRAFT_450440 [Thamnidium elegans]|uniref:Uncharacterized protein n=1 Tax=Thamnidium elegans TaxID=101142 RepID=A0A8H7SPP1_9FUNG|nr:hypothetical protein INT48_004408 [Thamnidium elegans]KAI8087285.1 hypothetical protein BDF21DRAFT_450440 [Thamnidium elegans]
MGDTNKSTPIYYEFEDYDYFGDFITSRYVKGYWTAFYALCLYWGFFWFSRHIFGDGNNHMFSREEAVHNLESDRNRNNRRHLAWTNSSTAIDIYTRLNRTCNSLRDITLLLLSALVINTMARGGKRSVMILAWIYFVMAVIWSIYEMISSHHLAKLSSSIVFYGICITIGAIAFQKGFDEFD